MYPYKIFKVFILIFVPMAVSIQYNCNANMIRYQKKDIENIIKETSYESTESCAKQGSIKCSTLMGASYFWGIGFKDKKIEYSNNMARHYLTRTLINSITSRSILAHALEYQQKLESKALLNSAATEGYYPAIYALAHQGPLKTDEEILKSIKWRKVQISLEPSDANIEKGFIGDLYLSLNTPDYSNALFWLNKASIEEDDMFAQHDMARLYAEGKGVEKDYVTAYMYYDLAGTAGAEEKSKLAELMTPEQVQEGLSRSHQWQDEHHSYRPGYGAWNDMGGIEWHVH